MKTVINLVFLFITISVLSISCNHKDGSIILSMAESVIESSPDSAFTLLSNLDESKLSDYEKAQVVLLKVIAKNKLDMEIANDTAIFDAIEIIERKGSYIEKAKVLLYAGRVLRDRHEYEKSLSFILDAQNYFSKIDDNNLKGMIMTDLGKLNFQEDHIDTAINCYKEAFFFFSKADRYFNQIVSLQMIGNCFLLSEKENKKDSSYFYFDKAIKISETYSEKSAHTSLLNNLGVHFIYYGEYQKVNQLLEDALFYSKNKIDSFHIFLTFAKAYFSLDYLDSATYYINKSIYFLEQKGSQFSPENYFSVYKLLSSIEEQKGNFETALRIKDRYVTLADSLYSELANLKLLEIQEKYQTKELENKEQKLLLQRKNIFIWLLFIIFLLLISVIIIFYFNQKNRMFKEKLNHSWLTIQKLQQTTDKLLKEKEKLEIQIKENENQTNLEDLKQKKDRIDTCFKIIEHYKQNGKITYSFMKLLAPELICSIENINHKLSEPECVLCCLLYLEFDHFETLTYLNFQKNTFHTRCSDIRVKFGMEPRGCIATFLKNKL
ncbi:MAG: hypothetical protein FWH18_10480 [Marinilabiliaceae bacterium]|nr:hypothetical protein [Marinilabiliaceae bacterium]